MGKALSFLGASLCLGMAVTATAQVAPDMFRDVPQEHWAYQAVESLRSKGILIGYPDGYFRGKRTLTRYEFAVALDRALKQVVGSGAQGEAGPPGPAGSEGQAGPAGPQGPPGVTPEELAEFKRLAQEFRQELANLGTNLNAVNARLDRLARDVADIKADLAKMPRITGGAFFGVRSDRANSVYADRDGRVLSPFGVNSLKNTPIVLHQLQLGVAAKIGSDANLTAKISSDNYKSYLGNSIAIVPEGGGLNTNPRSDTYVDQLELNAPFEALGRGGGLTIGRYLFNISPLTLWRPDVDTYFLNPMVNDGKFRLDGAKIATGFGSLGVTLFAGQTMRVQGTDGVAYNSPLAGIAPTALGYSLFAGNDKPSAQSALGQMVMDQVGGITLSLPLSALGGGSIHATAFHSSGTPTANLDLAESREVARAFTNVSVVGAGADVKIADRVNVTAEWAKSLTGTGKDIGNVTHRENNAFTGMVGYNAGALSLSAGYKYVDPLFYAPGYWGRIGNWINPTNVQGPVFRAGYDLTPAIGLNVGGDFFSGARNRQNIATGLGSIGTNDDINRVLVGLRWDISRSFRATVDWEGVYWKLSGAHSGAPGVAGTVHPTEHYITLGTGYNLNDTTVLKLGYQIGSFDGHNAINGASGAGGVYNFNVFTSQVAVKF